MTAAALDAAAEAAYEANYKSAGYPPPRPWGKCTPKVKNHWRAVARAILDKLRAKL